MVQFPTRRIPNFVAFQQGLRSLSYTLNITVKDIFRRLQDCNGRVAARVRVTDHDSIVRWSLGCVLLDTYILIIHFYQLPPASLTSRASNQLRSGTANQGPQCRFPHTPRSSSDKDEAFQSEQAAAHVLSVLLAADSQSQSTSHHLGRCLRPWTVKLLNDISST
jgi:hypothetical protein